MSSGGGKTAQDAAQSTKDKYTDLEKDRTITPTQSKDSVISGSISSNETDDSACNSFTGEKYWKMKFTQLQLDYDHLLRQNQTLEDRLLAIVDKFEKKKEELIANLEFEKSTLMADVNKLSTKLVDATIRLHDYEEKATLKAVNDDCFDIV